MLDILYILYILECNNIIDLGLLVDFSSSTEYSKTQLTNFVREVMNITAEMFTFSASKSHLAYLPFSTNINENIDGQWFDNQYIQTIEDGDKEALNQYLDRVIIPYTPHPDEQEGKTLLPQACYSLDIKLIQNSFFSLIRTTNMTNIVGRMT